MPDEEIMERRQDIIRNCRQECSPSVAASHSLNAQVAVDLAALHGSYDIAQIHFTSHRKVLGRLVIVIKRGLRRLLTPILERQVAYNTTNARLVSYVCEQMACLRQQGISVRELIEAVQTRQTELTGQIRELERQIATRWVDPRNQSVKTQYESGWDTYSEIWESSVRKPGLYYLGDEWGSPDLTDVIIDQYVKPYLQADTTVLEIGCGSGKFSEKLASLCKLLICADVSENMINRAKQRLQALPNIRFEKLNGLDLNQFSSGSMGFIFSFDCFVHIEIEDVYCYLHEIKRLLTPGGIGLLHFANLNSAEGWNKFVIEAPINRGNQKHFDRFCFLTWEIVEKFVNSLDLKIVASQREPWRDILVVFEK
jgi:ubiquinone/menaquinone biosynthesis C-methylase UbiE